MAVKYYKSEMGFFTVIADDTAFNTVSTFTHDTIIYNSGYTSEGARLSQIIPFSQVYGTVQVPQGIEVKANVYNTFATVFPLCVLVTHPNTAAGWYYVTMVKNSARRIGIFRNYNTYSQTATALSAIMRPGSTSDASDPDRCIPFGYGSHQMYNTTKVDRFELGIVIANTAMTSFKWVRFRVADDYPNRVYLDSIGAFNSNQITTLSEFFNGLEPSKIPTDPYDDIPESGPSTPSGTFDFTTSDKIGVPALPSLSAVSTGFVSLWSPTEAQMLQLSSFMWNANPLTIEFWKKIVADPMQLIYGLNIVPLDLDALGMIDSTGEVVVGLISTGVSMNHLSGQWVELDCGTVTLDETWSAYLDYDPYTKLEIYLPYCGTHPLRVDDFMPGTVKLTYHIDLLSGACVAIVTATKSDKHGDTLDSVVYQFMGNCAAQIPVTASQYADAVRSVIQLAASIGTMIAGAAGAGAAVAAETSALPASAGLAISSGAHQASAMVENVMGIKPNVERSGAIGATGGLLSVQTPYLILTRPRQARPKDQNTYTGYPSFITETLGDLEGWTQIQAIHLEGIPCTADELSEIDELLKSGVIF